MSDFDPERGAARENLCRFLAACYYEPGPEFAEEKLFDSMRAAAAALDPDWAALAARLGAAFAATDLADAARRLHAALPWPRRRTGQALRLGVARR